MNYLVKKIIDNETMIRVNYAKMDKSVVEYINHMMATCFPGIKYAYLKDMFKWWKYELILDKSDFDIHANDIDEKLADDDVDSYIQLLHSDNDLRCGITYNNSGLKLIGVTGGIGSGKSYMINKLKPADYVKIDLDSLAKELIISNENIIEFLSNIDELYIKEDNIIVSYDKTIMRDWLFDDRDALDSFNEVLIVELYSYIVEKYNNEVRPIIVEGATIFESLFCKYLDYAINVEEEDEYLLEDRLHDRGMSTSEIRKFQNNQLSNEVRRSLSDKTVISYSEFNDAVFELCNK